MTSWSGVCNDLGMSGQGEYVELFTSSDPDAGDDHFEYELYEDGLEAITDSGGTRILGPSNDQRRG